MCIQESNLHSSATFRIREYSALRSDLNRSRSHSPDDPHASGGVVIFVSQELSFSELSTSSYSSLKPTLTSKNQISLNNLSSLFFLNTNAPVIRSTFDR